MATPDFHAHVSTHEEDVPSWKSLHERIVAISEAIWSAVHIVLCVDSPEREHENAVDELFGPKDILSCSWRALRESRYEYSFSRMKEMGEFGKLLLIN